jgi:tetratricopeptide (TPR) repeat protein
MAFKKKKKKKSLWGRFFSSSSSTWSHSYDTSNGSITQQTIATTTSTSVRSVRTGMGPPTIIDRLVSDNRYDEQENDDDPDGTTAEEEDPDGSITDTSLNDLLLEDTPHQQQQRREEEKDSLASPSHLQRPHSTIRSGRRRNRSNSNHMSDITMMWHDGNTSVTSIPEWEEEPSSEVGGETDDGEESDDLTIEELLDRASALSIQKEYRKALNMYQHAFHRRRCSFENASSFPHPADMANLCFACTKLCERLSDFEMAMQYAQCELEYTQQIQQQSLAVARCYHELAKLSKYGLGNLEEALSYYQKAYTVEQACWEQARRVARECPQCSRKPRQKKRGGMPATGYCNYNNNNNLCDHHQTALEEVEYWMRESKNCIGRTSFELGYLDRALEML